MTKFNDLYSPAFKKDLKKIRFNFELQNRLENKIEEILGNPYHYKPLRNVLKNKRRVHIGSFVLIFEIKEEDNIIVFHSFGHHDEAY
jgi:YafQ family addiction module toxin component